jgi:conjugal transfer pilus assembly protein TraU
VSFGILNSSVIRLARWIVLSAALMLLSASNAHAQTPSYGCPDSDLLGAKLINGICWDCAFPWRLMGNMTFGGNAPKGATKKAVCTCNDSNGVPKPGTTAGFWNPARIIEVVRNPWCSPTVGGKKLMEAYRLVGNSRHSKLDDSFMNVHLLAFPVMQMLELLLDTQCNPESYVDLDFISMSEVDPSHNDSELDFFTNPFGAAFAQLETLAGGAAACVAETAGQETDEIFWWNGCIGPLFPMTGHVTNSGSTARATTLLGTKYLAKAHLLGLTRRTMGDNALCNGEIFPMMPKSQYRLQRFFPWGESRPNCCHSIGASTYTWGGEYRNIPNVSDYMYLLWRWTDCCMR